MNATTSEEEGAKKMFEMAIDSPVEVTRIYYEMSGANALKYFGNKKATKGWFVPKGMVSTEGKTMYLNFVDEVITDEKKEYFEKISIWHIHPMELYDELFQQLQIPVPEKMPIWHFTAYEDILRYIMLLFATRNKANYLEFGLAVPTGTWKLNADLKNKNLVKIFDDLIELHASVNKYVIDEDEPSKITTNHIDNIALNIYSHRKGESFRKFADYINEKILIKDDEGKEAQINDLIDHYKEYGIECKYSPIDNSKAQEKYREKFKDKFGKVLPKVEKEEPEESWGSVSEMMKKRQDQE